MDLDGRRARIIAKGCVIEYVYWPSGSAHLLPRLIRGRDRGSAFLSERPGGPGPSLEIIGDGRHKLLHRATDRAGNEETLKSAC